jgi:hypothetical protein
LRDNHRIFTRGQQANYLGCNNEIGGLSVVTAMVSAIMVEWQKLGTPAGVRRRPTSVLFASDCAEENLRD